MAIKGLKCPVGHTTIWKVGTVPTRTGPRVRYKCSTCARSFYAKGALDKPEPKPAVADKPKPKKARKPRAKKG